MCLTTKTVEVNDKQRSADEKKATLGYAKLKLLKKQAGLEYKKAFFKARDIDKQRRRLEKDFIKAQRKLMQDRKKAFSKSNKFNQRVEKMEIEISLLERHTPFILKQLVQVAKKDITVYKRFKKYGTEYHTPYQGMVWPVDKTVTVEKFGALPCSYSTYLTIHEGIHAYTNTPDKEIVRSNEVVKDMIIPKGTKYILSHDRSEIVALAMRMKKAVKKKKTAKKKNASKRK